MKLLNISVSITIMVMPAGAGLLSESRQWVIASSTGTNYNSPLPISLTHGGTVVGMDGSVPSISYAAVLSDTHTIKITTNIEGSWAFRAIIVGF